MPKKKAQHWQEVKDQIEGGIGKWRLLFIGAAWAEEVLPSANSVLPVSEKAFVPTPRINREAFAFQSMSPAMLCFVTHSTGSPPDICFVERPMVPLPVSPTNSDPNPIVRLYEDDHCRQSKESPTYQTSLYSPTIIDDKEFRPGYKDHPKLFFECQNGQLSTKVGIDTLLWTKVRRLKCQTH